MARTPSIGVLKLYYVETIVDIDNPTVAEVQTAGIDLTAYVLRDGVDTPQKGKTIPAAGVQDLYDATVPGSFGGDPISFRFFRDNVEADDLAWATLPPRTTGYMVVARFGGSGSPSSGQKNLNALAAGDRVEVWPVNTVSRESEKISDTTVQAFMVTASVPSSPSLDATIAA